MKSRKSISSKIWLAIVGIQAGLSLVANAEQQYISDKLVVNVYAEANQDSEKLTTLDSGDAVDVLEKSEGFTRIRLTDGREGWIKSSYLVAQMPAAARLKELEKERGTNPGVTAAAAEEIKKLKEQNTALQEELTAAKQAASQAAARADAKEPARSIVAEPPKNTGVSYTSYDDESVTPLHAWKWSAGIGLAAIVVGFLLGYRTIAKKIERKYGKLKIY